MAKKTVPPAPPDEQADLQFYAPAAAVITPRRRLRALAGGKAKA